MKQEKEQRVSAKCLPGGVEELGHPLKKSILQQVFDYDIAIGIIARMRSNAIRRKHSESTSEEEKQKASGEIKVYNAEESILNGYGSDDAKRSVYDKVFNHYARNREQSRQKIVELEPRNTLGDVLNYDVAIEILAWMRATANKARCAATSEEEQAKYMAEIMVYNAEQRILDFSGNDNAQLSVYDKVFNYYAPIVRAR